MTDNRLIFIISQPRSGSTLLNTLLTNSTEIKGMISESWILLPFLTYGRNDLVEAKFGYNLTIDANQKLISKKEYKNLINDLLLKIYSRKIENEKYFLDKTPRYYEILNEIRDYFPNSRIIILLRNPLDVFASINKRWPQRKIFDLAYFKRDILNAPVLINSFLESHKKDQNIFHLKYESLVSEPAVHLKNLFKWLNIEYKTEYLNYNIQEDPLFGDNLINKSFHSHTRSLNTWKNLLSNKNLKLFIEGYIHYLLENDYAYYDLAKFKHRSNHLFRSFKSYCDFLENSGHSLSINNILNSFKYYIISKTIYGYKIQP